MSIHSVLNYRLKIIIYREWEKEGPQSLSCAIFWGKKRGRETPARHFAEVGEWI